MIKHILKRIHIDFVLFYDQRNSGSLQSIKYFSESTP